MITGIICAMEEEVALLRQDIISERVETIAQRDFYVGELYGKQVVLVMSRIGKVAASLTAGILLDHFKVGRVVFSGTAGGVDPQMNVGDAVIADYSVQHDMKVPGGEPFRIPMLGSGYLASDKELNETAVKAVAHYIENDMLNEIPQEYLDLFAMKQPKLVVGTIASGDEFVCEKHRNQWLYENVNNIKCVEMEGAAVAQACCEFEVPFTVIRIVSDCANDDASVDFDLFITGAAKYFTRGTVRALLERLAQ